MQLSGAAGFQINHFSSLDGPKYYIFFPNKLDKRVDYKN